MFSLETLERRDLLASCWIGIGYDWNTSATVLGTSGQEWIGTVTSPGDVINAAGDTWGPDGIGDIALWTNTNQLKGIDDVVDRTPGPGWLGYLVPGNSPSIKTGDLDLFFAGAYETLDRHPVDDWQSNENDFDANGDGHTDNVLYDEFSTRFWIQTCQIAEERSTHRIDRFG